MSKQRYGCLCLGFLTCTQLLLHVIARMGWTDTVKESALNVDSGRKIPCCTGESNLPQWCASLTWALPTELHLCLQGTIQVNYRGFCIELWVLPPIDTFPLIFNLTTMWRCVDGWNAWWSESDSGIQTTVICLIWLQLTSVGISVLVSLLILKSFVWNPYQSLLCCCISACGPDMAATLWAFCIACLLFVMLWLVETAWVNGSFEPSVVVVVVECFFRCFRSGNREVSTLACLTHTLLTRPSLPTWKRPPCCTTSSPSRGQNQNHPHLEKSELPSGFLVPDPWPLTFLLLC